MHADRDTVVDVIVTLLVLGAIVAVIATAVMVAGCVCAFLAGRGSRGALGGWLALATLEVMAQVFVLANLANGRFDVGLIAPTVALSIQLALYLVARAGRPPGPGVLGYASNGPPPPPKRPA